ncbi:3 beta-hydroxysteroid dehydrogenase type 7-like [Hyla sarda]|uniref:3 beta-hydroxysteroid dehydrogenase type 7-like n=1 Tax=Hyla sarda TaxID=327740 RepID=UPI0024C2B987|nr:3 beta-hydroxysteroid dehydrogenase type 7-like [Hyla sarda]
MEKDLVYLVTGGCGFIGEWIVKLLLKEDYVKEVRIFDLNESEAIKHLDTAYTAVTFVKGDITEFSQILSAVEGVDVVIHTAALVDYLDVFPFKKLEAINVGGTENVINACLVKDVPYLVYTSSIAAVGPNINNDPLVRVTEDTLYPGEPSLSYGRTKAQAEKLTRLANGQQTKNGKKLITCVIRPSNVYGDKTPNLLSLYKSAKSKYNRLNYIEPDENEHSLTYVGNIAWMHVLAAQQMQLHPDRLGGQVYYTYDDTPFKHRVKLHHDLFTEMDPDIEIGEHVPYWKMWIIVFIYSLIKVIVRPVWNVKPFMTLPVLKLMTISYSHDTDKAFRDFGYKPLFTWVESKQRTCQWLKQATQQQGNEDRNVNC